MMDGKNRLKHVECLTEINKLWKVVSCWLYSANILAIHGPVNVTFLFYLSLPQVTLTAAFTFDIIKLLTLQRGGI